MGYEIKIVDLPNIKEPDIIFLWSELQKCILLGKKLLMSILIQNKNHKYSLGIASSAIERLIECAISIQLLAIKGRSRDTAVLLLTIFELQLDLRYIELKREREDIWLNNTKEHTKPWRVGDQLKELFPNADDLKLEKETYKHCSMAKHGNPAGGVVGFNLYFENEEILINDDEILLRNYLTFTSIYLYRGFNAASKLLERHGFNFDEIQAQIIDFEKSLLCNFSEIMKSLVLKGLIIINQKNVALESNFEKVNKDIQKLQEDINQIKESIKFR